MQRQFSKRMNLPNFFTLLRIVLSGVFLYIVFFESLWLRIFSLFIFLIATLTDYLDGAIARRLNQMTPFGKLMDPIADKFLTLSAFLAFVQMGIVPAWMVVIILTRDILITVVRLSVPDVEVGARKSGKQKTVLQFACIYGILFFLVIKKTSMWNESYNNDAKIFIYWSMLFITAMTVWSGVRYLYKNLKNYEKNNLLYR